MVKDTPPTETETLQAAQTAATLMSVETQSFWHIVTTHILALTIIAAMATTSCDPIVTIIASAFGALVTFLWQQCLEGSNEWQKKYQERARAIESALSESLRVVSTVQELRDKELRDRELASRDARSKSWVGRLASRLNIWSKRSTPAPSVRDVVFRLVLGFYVLFASLFVYSLFLF